MRRTTVMLVACALLAGCGDGDDRAAGTAEPEADVPTDQPPELVLRDFVAAAGDAEAQAMFRLLTEETQQRLGPGLEQFAAGQAHELEEGVGSFARDGDFDVVVSERLEDDLAVVTIAGRRTAEGMRELAAFAAILRREGGAWRISLGGGPAITPLAPQPGERVRSEPTPTARVASADAEVSFWIDGRGARPEESPQPIPGEESERTVGVDLVPPLDPGRHVVTVVARDGAEANAVAWAFTVV